MKKIFIVVAFFSIASFSFSDDRTQSLVDSLRRQGIDSIGVFTTFCNGGYLDDEPVDTCQDFGIYNNSYILWKKNAKCFIVKKSKCYSYEPYVLENCVFFDFYEAYNTEIKREKILPQGCSIKIEHGDTIITRIIISVHGCATIISFFTLTDSLRIRLDNNDFDKDSNYQYFEHNKNLKSYKWSLEIKEQIEYLEKNRLFVKRN